MRRLFLFILLVLTACTATATPAPQPTATVTVTGSQPTATPNPPMAEPPTATPTPTLPTLTPTDSPTLIPTSYAPLQTEGPYFVYLKEQDGQQVVVMMDANGSGRKIVPLPKDISLPWPNHDTGVLDTAISPDGNWLAFYTGTEGFWSNESKVGPFDLDLNLLNLHDGQFQKLTRLLSEDYPDNFLETAEKLSTSDPVNYPLSSLPSITSGLRMALAAGIQSLAWSPDGRYLAFAGEMDGPSSDVYLYDTRGDTIKRMTDGQEEIQSIMWSPDGEWIVHNSAYYRGEGDSTTFYAASVDGSIVKRLSSSNNGIYGWLSPSIWLESDGENGPGNFGLRSVDIETGNVKMLWDSPWVRFVVDKQSTTLLLTQVEKFEYFGQLGLYLVNYSTREYSMISDSPFWNIRIWGISGIPFIAQSYYEGNNSTLAIYADGSTSPIDEKWFRANKSPDNKWIITDSEIYDSNLQPVGKIDAPFNVDRSFWVPDSSGEFLLFGSNLYFISIPDGTMWLVDENVLEKHHFDYTWVAGK